MCAKYVPPHLRGKQEETSGKSGLDRLEESLAADADRGGGGDRWGDRKGDRKGGDSWGGGKGGRDRDKGGSKGGGGGRFDSLFDEDSGGGRKGGGKSGKGKGRDRDRNSWFYREDGRRPNSWDEPSEGQVFGARKSVAGINFDEYDKIPVQVSGNDADPDLKIERFSEANLCESLSDNLWRCGYERPTPVQKHSIPLVVEGRDVMACAQTGSGKTCAFMVPAIESLLRSGPPPPPESQSRLAKKTPMPCALVMAPTRELTSQIHEESRKFAFNTGIRCCVVYGGADMRDQRRELNNGCDVLVATPGRLTDMFDRGLVSLGYIQFLILDEADRMLDMGFEPQVRRIVEETDMGKYAQRERQSMMFSATFPKQVQTMARDFLYDYIFLTVGRVGSASELVEQMMLWVDDRDRAQRLEDVLDEHLPADGLALVFVETKAGVDRLESDMVRKGLPVAAIHGDRDQRERERALESFRRGRTPVLLATDVASRGLDIPNVHVVVNYDMPKMIDDYVHRIGRTGRAGRKGKALTFLNDKVAAPLLRELYEALDEANQDIPDWFEDIALRHRFGGRPAKGRKKGGGGGSRFGGRDMRDGQFGGRSGGKGGSRGKGGDRKGGGGSDRRDRDGDRW